MDVKKAIIVSLKKGDDIFILNDPSITVDQLTADGDDEYTIMIVQQTETSSCIAYGLPADEEEQLTILGIDFEETIPFGKERIDFYREEKKIVFNGSIYASFIASMNDTTSMIYEEQEIDGIPCNIDFGCVRFSNSDDQLYNVWKEYPFRYTIELDRSNSSNDHYAYLLSEIYSDNNLFGIYHGYNKDSKSKKYDFGVLFSKQILIERKGGVIGVIEASGPLHPTHGL